uniref:Prod1 n=1 Tax=Hypselotriton orientalis TaxID=3399148 RepID=A0A0F6QFB4_9SALA|nr:Prod1 [Cynops orientalis]
MTLLPFSLFLVMCLHSATALKCFTKNGDDSTVTTCAEEQTRCLYIQLPSSVIQECNTAQQCAMVLEEATAIGYPGKCCSEDLCNRSEQDIETTTQSTTPAFLDGPQ